MDTYPKLEPGAMKQILDSFQNKPLQIMSYNIGWLVKLTRTYFKLQSLV